jgi:hypothetical protein
MGSFRQGLRQLLRTLSANVAALPVSNDRVLLEDFAIAQVPHGMFLLDENLFKLWRDGLVDKEEILLKAKKPAELAAKIAAVERAWFRAHRIGNAERARFLAAAEEIVVRLRACLRPRSLSGMSSAPCSRPSAFHDVSPWRM